jgi:hypothetical protein
MSDDNQIHLTTGGPSHFDMDEAFCTRMRMAIAVGLEHAPIGVVTTNPKYVPTKLRPLVFSRRDMELA